LDGLCIQPSVDVLNQNYVHRVDGWVYGSTTYLGHLLHITRNVHYSHEAHINCRESLKQ